VATDLTRIGEKARKEPGLVFTSLYHHIYDVDNLRACYDTLGAKKATGVDGVTKEEYGKNLEGNLQDLSGRLRRMGYRPGPKKRVYIPKPGSEKGRPLGIQRTGRQDSRRGDQTHPGADLRGRIRGQQLRVPTGAQSTPMFGGAGTDDSAEKG